MSRMNPGSEDEFFAARDAIVEDFAAWAEDRDVDPSEVQVLLDFKWMYADGDLGLWTVADVEEFLHDWYPRKVLADPEDAPHVTAAVGSFFEFLESRGLLERRGAGVRKLKGFLTEHEACLAEGLEDPEMRGPATAIVAAMMEDGVDLNDDAAVQNWIAEFNEGPIERRDAILGWDEPSELPEPVELVTRPEPSREAVRASARKAPILDLFAKFVDYVGDRLDLTARGNLRLADARRLIDILGTSDEMDESWGGRKVKTKTSTYLRDLDSIYRWARNARVVREARGRLHPVKAWKELAEDPLPALNRVVDVAMEAGPYNVYHRRWSVNDDRGLVDEMVPLMLARLYEQMEPDPYEEYLDALVEVARMSRPDPMGPEWARLWYRRELDAAVEVLERAGVLVRRGSKQQRTRWGGLQTLGGTLELTTYGVAFVQRWLPGLGWIVPILPEFDATPEDPPEDIVAALADLLEASGPSPTLDALASFGNEALQQMLIDRLWRVDDDATVEVLNAIGRHHMSKPVAKSARKAAIQHQSWRAGL